MADSKPSTLMAGIKFFTRSISFAKASSINVALVKERNWQSLCFSHRAIRSFLRTRGSPPVYMYIYTPISLPWVIMESISSKVRFSLLPYSAAQQPVQCRLQAEVGSSRMAQGILQLYFFRYSSCFGQPMIFALRKKFSKVAFRTSESVSFRMFITS